MSRLMRSPPQKNLQSNQYVTALYVSVTLYTKATEQLSENIAIYVFRKVDLYKAVSSL